MYIHRYIYLYLYIYIYVYLLCIIDTDIDIYAYTYICKYIYAFWSHCLLRHTYAYIYIHIYVCMYTNLLFFIETSIQLCVQEEWNLCHKDELSNLSSVACTTHLPPSTNVTEEGVTLPPVRRHDTLRMSGRTTQMQMWTPMPERWEEHGSWPAQWSSACKFTKLSQCLQSENHASTLFMLTQNSCMEY